MRRFAQGGRNNVKRPRREDPVTGGDRPESRVCICAIAEYCLTHVIPYEPIVTPLTGYPNTGSRI